MNNDQKTVTGSKTESGSSEYLLLFRGRDWDEGMSAEELERSMSTVIAWFEGLRTRGIVKGGHPLAREGRIVAAKGSGVADGPFIESKESVGGYLILQVESLNEALSIAKACPTLAYGITIEVRPLMEECPVFKRANARLIFASA